MIKSAVGSQKPGVFGVWGLRFGICSESFVNSWQKKEK